MPFGQARSITPQHRAFGRFPQKRSTSAVQCWSAAVSCPAMKHVVLLEHRGDAIETETIELELVQPPPAVGEKES